MANFPSRRALFAFARLVSADPKAIRCPDCVRVRRTLQTSCARQRWPGVRRFGGSAIGKSDQEPEEGDLSGDLLQFQLSTRRADGSRVPVPPVDVDQEQLEFEYDLPSLSDGFLNKEVEEVEAGLEMSEMAIEELEDALMDVEPAETRHETRTGEEDFVPWYMRQEGDISEDEYASIEDFINSDSKATPSQTLESQMMHEKPQKGDSDVVPWYLREDETDTSLIPRIDLPQSQLEKFPDLPVGGPPLLQPLISRLFYDHHLQNIVLLDLRKRDPPPAWGSNTIMILATVRSERQLSSVAEATAKWLKSIADVQPRIDGLPKRESLIIKRRRLRRKSLRKPGYLVAAPRPTTWVSMYTGYSGLVLQLFTAEGREEYDLEDLWGDKRVVDAGIIDMKPRKMRPGGIEEDERVETSVPSSGQKKPLWEKKADKDRKKWEKMKEEKASKKRWTKQEKEVARQKRMQDASEFNIWGGSAAKRISAARSRFGDRQQRRQLHSSSPKHLDIPEATLPEIKTQDVYWKKPGADATLQKQAAWWGTPQYTLPRLSDTVLPSSVYEQLLDDLKDQPPFSTRDAAMDRLAQTIALQGDRQVAEKLSNLCASNDPANLLLLAHFGNLSRFIRMSQSTERDFRRPIYSMDPFPETGFQWAFEFFLRDMPIRPTPHHWRLAILFYLNLQIHNPKVYDIKRLRDILLLPVSQGISIPVSTFHLIINHIAISSPEFRNGPDDLTTWVDFRHNVSERLNTIESFLQYMSTNFGYDYRNDEEIYLALYKACCQAYPTPAQLVKDINQPLATHHNDLRRILIKHYLEQRFPVSPEFFMLELMQFAYMRKWRSFMKRWNGTRSAGIGKNIDMWTCFWAIMARSGHEYHIRHTLRENFDEMMDEGGHLVLNRDVARAIARCLQVVDPYANEFHNQRRVVTSMLETLE